jgi:DNA polymerase-4
VFKGVDDREVQADRVRKSIGAESTFSSDVTDFEHLLSELQPLINKVWQHSEGKGSRGRTATLKVRFSDFEIITRSRSVPSAVAHRDDLAHLMIGLLKENMPFPKPVRLLGVSLSSLKAIRKQNHRSWISAFEAD